MATYFAVVKIDHAFGYIHHKGDFERFVQFDIFIINHILWKT